MMTMPSSLKSNQDLDDGSSLQSYDTNSCERSTTTAAIEVPGEHDLLLGRGGETNSHIGNIRFRKLIEEYKPIYLAASRRDKPEIAKHLVCHWKSLGGRFLEKHKVAPSGGEPPKKLWFEINDEAAKKRASKSLGEKQKFYSLNAGAFSSETSSRSPTEKFKPNLKTRLRNLEARTTHNQERACPRSDPVDLSFPVIQSPQEGRAHSFLYQPLRFEMPQLQLKTSDSDGTSDSSMSRSYISSLAASPTIEESRQQDAFSNLMDMQPLGTRLAANVLQPFHELDLTLQISVDSSFRTSNNFTATGNQSILPLSSFPQLEDQHADVPTAAELTSCWDE